MAKVKTRVKSAVNTVMTQFVRLWWQKKWQSGKKKAKGKKLSGQNDNDNHTYTYTYKYDF